MDLEQALEVFNIEDIASEDTKSIKKKYKKLMLKHHPDNCGGDESKAKEITLAFDIIKNAINNIRKYNAVNRVMEDYTIVIPISKLIKLYNGEKVKVSYGDNKQVFGIKEIQKYNTLIISDTTIVYNGISYDFQSIQHWSISDEYVINCEILVENINNSEQIKVVVNGIEKSLDFTSQRILIPFILDKNVKVNVRIVKKLITNSEKAE